MLKLYFNRIIVIVTYCHSLCVSWHQLPCQPFSPERLWSQLAAEVIVEVYLRRTNFRWLIIPLDWTNFLWKEYLFTYIISERGGRQTTCLWQVLILVKVTGNLKEVILRGLELLWKDSSYTHLPFVCSIPQRSSKLWCSFYILASKEVCQKFTLYLTIHTGGGHCYLHRVLLKGQLRKLTFAVLQT